MPELHARPAGAGALAGTDGNGQGSAGAPAPAAQSSVPAPAFSARALLARSDEWLSSAAVALMVLIPLVEIALRPLLGKGIENGPVVVQHLGLVMAMLGAVAAERNGHLATLGSGVGAPAGGNFRGAVQVFANGSAAILCGVLAQACWALVASERGTTQTLAYGIPLWWIQLTMPVGFLLLGIRLGGRTASGALKWVLSLLLPAAGYLLAGMAEVAAGLPLWPFALGLLAMLLAGAPIFAVMGGLALALFALAGQPLAAVALSHYQITVNPSLPALPLFTLAGLVFARTRAAERLGALFVAVMGGGTTGTVMATALLCSCFTAFTGGSGVTILALGGLLLPLLRHAGYPEQRGIGLVTSASALGVLLAPSVPLIMYAVLARVPIGTMFLAGVLPALVMVGFLLVVGGYLRREGAAAAASVASSPPPARGHVLAALWSARWELLAPVLAIGSLASGLATPTESAALTAAYAIVTQALHRELPLRQLARCLIDCAQIIGGVMLIRGMALGVTNTLIDAGVPDAAIEWVQRFIPNKFVFLLVLSLFLFAAGALMEIFAAIVVLVPLLLPVAQSYGIEPVHFGIIFLAAMEMGFLCPPAGMNIYFAAMMFNKPVRYVARSVLPALFAIFLGTLVIACVPQLATGLPSLISTVRR